MLRHCCVIGTFMVFLFQFFLFVSVCCLFVLVFVVMLHRNMENTNDTNTLLVYYWHSFCGVYCNLADSSFSSSAPCDKVCLLF